MTDERCEPSPHWPAGTAIEKRAPLSGAPVLVVAVSAA